MDTASPYNKRIEPTAGGCHAACFRKRPASSLRALLLRRRTLRPSSRLIRALYGRKNEMRFIIEDINHSEWQGEFKTLDEAILELKKRSLLPWDQAPNLAPCEGWKTCGRDLEIIKFDDSVEPWNEVKRISGFEVSRNGIKWKSIPI